MSSDTGSSYLAVAELEKHHLPDSARFVKALRVKHHPRDVREEALRTGRFAYKTCFKDWYAPEEAVPLPGFLCFARYRESRHVSEILTSLDGKPFAAATFGRLCDLCKDHPGVCLEDDAAFLGTSHPLGRCGYTDYPALSKAPDGLKALNSVINQGRLKPDCWLIPLQPTTDEVAKILETIVQAEEATQAHPAA